jgi:hypothetical protein
VDEAEVAVGVEQYDALPDDVERRFKEIWEQSRGG